MVMLPMITGDSVLRKLPKFLHSVLPCTFL